MAWTRVVQTGFEMGRASETPFSNSLGPPYQHSTTRPITGELSFNQTGDGGLGFQLNPEPTQIRTGFMFNTVGSLEDVPLLIVYTRESGGFGQLVWYYQQLSRRVWIWYTDQNDTIVDSDYVDMPAYYGFTNSKSANISLGLVMTTGAGGYASFYINGEKALYFASTATGMEQSTAIFAIKIGETLPGFAGMYETHFDDWYIDSGSGEPDTAPPTIRYDIIRPDGTGDFTQWNSTPGVNYQAIDEQIGDDSDYVYESTTGNKDTLLSTNSTIPADSTVVSAIPIARAKAGTPGAGFSFRFLSYDLVLTDTGSDQTLLVGYKYFWERFLTAPDGTSWDQTKIDANEFGYELRP